MINAASNAWRRRAQANFNIRFQAVSVEQQRIVEELLPAHELGLSVGEQHQQQRKATGAQGPFTEQEQHLISLLPPLSRSSACVEAQRSEIEWLLSAAPYSAPELQQTLQSMHDATTGFRERITQHRNRIDELLDDYVDPALVWRYMMSLQAPTNFQFREKTGSTRRPPSPQVKWDTCMPDGTFIQREDRLAKNYDDNGHWNPGANWVSARELERASKPKRVVQQSHTDDGWYIPRAKRLNAYRPDGTWRPVRGLTPDSAADPNRPLATHTPDGHPIPLPFQVPGNYTNEGQ
jgi:hypothetical protein